MPTVKARRQRSWRWLLIALATALLSGAASPATSASKTPKVRIRLEWGGRKPDRWTAVLELSDGRFEQPRALGVEAGDPGSARLRDGAVWIHRKLSRAYDGFDVTIEARPSVVLSLTLKSLDGSGLDEQLQWSLSELYTGVRAHPIGKDGGRLVIRRAPGDALSARIDRPHLIYGPGDTFSADVRLNLIGPSTRDVAGTFTWELRQARSQNVLREGRLQIQTRTNQAIAEGVPVQCDLPSEEGVYDVVCRFSGSDAPLEGTSIQLVVLSKDRELRESAEAVVRVVDSFEPERAGFFRKLRRPSRAALWEDSLNRLTRVLPSWQRDASNAEDEEGKRQWDAYRLEVDHPGRPHRLVLKLPGGVAQHVGISILEPNAEKQLMPIGLDSGVIIVGDDAQAVDEQHEILFWPKVRDPLLLLHAMRSGESVHVKHVQLEELSHLPRRGNAVVATGGRKQRLIGPYLHKPLIPENFGGSEALDAASRRSLDDWRTFVESTKRLTAYLQYQGNNALQLTVMADGSALYPSRLLEPSPRFDTGAYFSTGQDPIRKDVLELVLRVFDREGLMLLPTLRFSSPLPTLERLLKAEPDGGEGIELVGPDGRTWRETHGPVSGAAPIYNPLDPRVQRAIKDVTRELVQRYRTHPSLAGVAIELSRLGYLQFPGIQWGYDKATIARFERQTGIRVPVASGRRVSEQHAARYRFLTTRARTQWIGWRCAELRRLHGDLAKIVTDAGPSLQFVLSGNRVLSDEEMPPTTSVSRKQVEGLLALRGLNFREYGGIDRLVLLQPILESIGATSDADAGPLGRADTEAAMSGIWHGSLIYRPPLEVRLAEFDANSPWQPAFTWLVAHASRTDATHRRHYLRSLAQNDSRFVFGGGWMIPLGQEESTRRIRELLQALPAIPFATSEAGSQPALIRIGRADGSTFVYVVNEFPEPIHVRLWFSCEPDLDARTLVDERRLTIYRSEKTGCYTDVTIGPYDAWAARLERDDVRLIDARVRLSKDAVAGLKAKVDGLRRQMAHVREMSAPQRARLDNPGFEANDGRGRKLPGWDVASARSADWTIDRSNPRSGRSALRLSSAESNTSIVSEELSLEGGRFLVMSLWLRSDRDGADVRLAFEGLLEGRPHVQYAGVRVGTRWRKYLFRVRDIPHARLTEARVRVEVRGEARLWVDDVDIQTFLLTAEDARHLTKVYSSIALAWGENRFGDCQRLLESYWGRYLSRRMDAVPFSPPQSADRRLPTGDRPAN